MDCFCFVKHVTRSNSGKNDNVIIPACRGMESMLSTGRVVGSVHEGLAVVVAEDSGFNLGPADLNECG
jgi:hypothetical protein